MIMNMYSVFDIASGVFDRPFCALSDGAALRSFGDICQDAEHPIGKHPEDFSLYWIGAFNDNDGVLSVVDRKCLISGLESVAASRNVNREQMDLLSKQVNNGVDANA